MTDKIEILHKEIDLLQGCINRMAQNSFMIKGWCLSLVVAVLAFIDKNINPILLCLILILPIIGFWYLDSFFLRTEKLYRKKYEWVIKNRNKSDEDLYDLNPRTFDKKVESQWKIMFSKTLFTFYGIPLVIVVIAILFIFFGPNKQIKKNESVTIKGKETVEVKATKDDISEPTLVISASKKRKEDNK